MFPNASSGLPRLAGTATRPTSSASTDAAIAVLPRSVSDTPNRLTVERMLSPSRLPPSVSTASPPVSLSSDKRCFFGASSYRIALPVRATAIKATTNQMRSSAPSRRERSPSRLSIRVGSGEIAVQSRKPFGKFASIGAITAPSPATPSARKVTPPKTVPAAAPGSPLALAAIPAARFSNSNPESSTTSTNGDVRRRLPTPRRPSTNASAPPTMSAMPRTRPPRASAVSTALASNEHSLERCLDPRPLPVAGNDSLYAQRCAWAFELERRELVVEGWLLRKSPADLGIGNSCCTGEQVGQEDCRPVHARSHHEPLVGVERIAEGRAHRLVDRALDACASPERDLGEIRMV